MTRFRMLQRAALASLGLALAGTAAAHPGHGAGDFAAGVAHPFAGLDHLLAMVTVGLWAALALPAARRWLAPAVFVATMAGGALLARSGLFPAAATALLEPALAASVVLLGALVACGTRVAPRVGLGLVGAAAVLHGAAHGLELAAGGSALAFGAGFVLATAALHGAGLAAGATLLRGAGTLRRAAGAWTGATIGACGLLLLAARA